MNEDADYTVKRLAYEAGVTVQYVRQEINAGRLEGVKRGRDWFIPYQAAVDWLAKRRAR